jgi:hypothetical protein
MGCERMETSSMGFKRMETRSIGCKRMETSMPAPTSGSNTDDHPESPNVENYKVQDNLDKQGYEYGQFWSCTYAYDIVCVRVYVPIHTHFTMWAAYVCVYE